MKYFIHANDTTMGTPLHELHVFRFFLGVCSPKGYAGSMLFSHFGRKIVIDCSDFGLKSEN